MFLCPGCGSHRNRTEQGFITQRVTQWHNRLSWLFLACLMIEAGRRRSYGLWGMAAALAVTDIALVVWHALLTGMMDFKQHVVPGGVAQTLL